MSTPLRFRRLTYPLCLALSWSSLAAAQEANLPEPLLPLAIESEAPLGTGVLTAEAAEEPLVPPLPTRIDELPPLPVAPQPVASESTPLEPQPYVADPNDEPAALLAEAQELPALPRQQSEETQEITPQQPAEPENEVTPPLTTRVADPLAELRAQQEALHLREQTRTAELPESAPRSVLLPEALDLSPIGQAEMPVVDPHTIEVVNQRFPNGNIKLAYEVGRDADDNYVKHGQWKLFNLGGDVVAQGEYQNNQRHGMWRRWHNGADAPLFLQSPYTSFTPPFYSEAEFKHDQLDGSWSIADSQHRTVSEIQFRDGVRHGKATWWHPNGTLMQEIDFVDGELHGELKLFNAEGQPLAHHVYKHGRRETTKTAKYPNGQKKSEGLILEARTFITEPDDWWNAKTAVFTKEGMDEKHGLWRQWHPNGTLHVEGNYEHHAEDGKFTWWYASGQKALVGHYQRGQRDGQWAWWHPNGQKQSEGTFAADEAVATWIWWNEDGSVARRARAGSEEESPASRTAEGTPGTVKPTAFEASAPRLLPVPATVR